MTRRSPTTVHLPLLAGLALVAGSCSLVPAPIGEALGVPAGEPVVVVTEEGGLCATGSCASQAAFFPDGVVVRSDGSRDRVPPQEWAATTEGIVSTDWEAVLARPFAGTCPTAFDGTELTFDLRTPTGPVSVGSCDVVIDWTVEPFAGLARWLHDARP